MNTSTLVILLLFVVASITQQSCNAFSQILRTHTALMQQHGTTCNSEILTIQKTNLHQHAQSTYQSTYQYHHLHQSKSRLYMIGDFFNFDKKKGTEQQESTIKEEEEEETISKKSEYADDDPVEKIFNFFFGEKEENPMGLARFGAERFPEQYPATKDEWAEPVAADDADMKILRPFLKNTNLESRELQLTYDANRDGWDALSFHNAVDKKGGAIVMCVTRMGIVCGGYNPKGWVGYGEARGSIAAFLYVVGGKYAKAGAPGTKLQKVGGPGLAQMDMPEGGPSFGADSLVIPFSNNNPKLARSKLGSYYERFEDGTNSLFGKDASVQLKDLKVFHGVYEEGEYIPFTDAEPFALY